MTASAKLDLVETLDLSVVVPVMHRVDDLDRLHADYRAAVAATGRSHEFIYVVDGGPGGGARAEAAHTLDRLAAAGEPIVLIRFNREFGEAACLREGVRRSGGRHILFLPAYFQVGPGAITDIVARLDEADVVTANRRRSADSPFNRLRGWGFERMARFVGARYADPGCFVRAAHRSVFSEVSIQDEKQRFLPLLAEMRGFKVLQMTVPQADSDGGRPQHRPGVYIDVVLDLVAVSFLLRFLQRPFRFFGTIGAASILSSLALMAYMLFEREVSNVPLGDRPMLVLVVLLMVLGIQTAAIGLIAEIIIFTRSDGRTHYAVETVVEQVSADA